MKIKIHIFVGNNKIKNMKKLLLSSLIVFATTSANAQFTLINENFDSFTDFAISGFGNWQTLDIDGLNTYTGGGAATPWTNAGTPQAYIIFNPTAAGVINGSDGENTNFDPHSGTKYAACWDAVPANGVTANNDWLISPAITLGLTGNSLTFWVKSLSNDFGLEKYKVGVYVGSGTPTSAANFTIISGAAGINAPITWTQVTQSLQAYAGQTVRVGIQCVSSDNYMMMVDDFKITATTLGTSETAIKKTLSIYPNPTTDIINVITKDKITDISVYDLSGKKMTIERANNFINVKHLQNGTYIINIETPEGKSSQKFIKK